MIVMPANNSSALIHHLAGRYPGLLGHLYSPGGQRGPYPWLPYALDNGAFGAFTTGKPFDSSAWHELLLWARAAPTPPRWTLVPDVVGDRRATLAAWDFYAPSAAAYGWPLAFAAQDGMSPEDAPPPGGGDLPRRLDGVEARRDRALVRPVPPRPRRPDQHLPLAARLRGRWRGIGRRHRLDARRPGTAAGARAMAERGERRDRTRGPDPVVVRRFKRPDGSWVEVVRCPRTGAMWRRHLPIPHL